MVTTSLHIGNLLTGRINVTLSGQDLPTSLRWTDVLNGAGSIDGVTIPEATVRKYELRQQTHGIRSFLAVEVDNRIKQAGPVLSRTWDDDAGVLTLGASGMWAYFDRRIIYPTPAVAPYAAQSYTVTGKSLGGLARALVEHAISQTYGNVPVVLPADESGTHTEFFPLYSLLDYGEQLRQITQRAVDAPDIRFAPRRTAADPRFIEWVMQVGTDAQPGVFQAGPNWVLDKSAPKSPVMRISTDEDATDMASQVWSTGNGQEQSTLMDAASSTDLTDLGWPLIESKISKPTVEDQATLTSHTESELLRVNRPIEVLKVSARASAYNEVAAGDYCRTITRDDAWLGDYDATTRVRQVSGDLSDEVLFEMFSVQASL